MMEKLIAKGGLQTITCWAQTCDYAAVAIESFHHYSERLSKGMPLHWAICRKKAFLVRLLLEQGAPIQFNGPSPKVYTTLEQAAYLHEAGILRLMIEKHAPYPRAPAYAVSNRGTIVNITDQPPRSTVLRGVAEMIKAAIDGSDRYSLLVRHGDRYKSHMR